MCTGSSAHQENQLPSIDLAKSSKRFMQLCDQLKAMHLKKAMDYGSGRDPLGNFAQATDWGSTPFIGCMIRAGDKVARIQSFIKKGNLQNESVQDSLIDLAAYALLGYVLLEQERPATDGSR